ncbi:MAG: hypothetical protein QGH14_06465, partial [Candidatus Bathyarchaeota archaeon]|nr:hypothetical protein [Candidatus Bathyarchaeota archaeon]
EKKDVIVVKWDGYVEEDYLGFYRGTPYDIQNMGRGMDFGAYFLHLVAVFLVTALEGQPPIGP